MWGNKPEKKEEKAEGAARYAADELKQAREIRESYQQQLRREHHEAADNQAQRPGLMSSVIGAIESTYEHAKEAVTGKSHDASEKAKETAESASERMRQSHDAAAARAREAADRAREGRDNTVESLRQTKDYAAERAKDAKDYVADKAEGAKETTVGKAKDAKDYVAGKAREAKDKTAEKAGEMKDYTEEKAKEGKDTTVGKLGELKESAADVARKAMGFLSGKKDEAKEKVGETAEASKEKTKEMAAATKGTVEEAKDRSRETKEEAKDIYKCREEEARRKMEEMRLQKLREKGYDMQDEVDERDRAHREAAALRGDAARSNILGNVAEAIKSKLTMPSDTADETRAGGVHGGKVVVTMEETPAGAGADLLKEADQITGQSFSPNDVRKLGSEGTGIGPGRG